MIEISYISSLYSVEKAIEYCYKHVKAKQNNLKSKLNFKKNNFKNNLYRANIYYKKKYKRIDSLTFPTEIRTILPDDIADMGQKINAID